MADQSDKEFEALRKDLQALRADMETLTKDLRGVASERVDRAKAAARDAGEGAQKQAEQLKQTVVGQVEERPLTALFAAFGVGVLVGTLFGRRG